MNTKTSNQLQVASDEVAISMSKVNKWFGNFVPRYRLIYL